MSHDEAIARMRKAGWDQVEMSSGDTFKLKQLIEKSKDQARARAERDELSAEVPGAGKRKRQAIRRI